MNRRLELAERRGRLRERIARQRRELGLVLAPAGRALACADRLAGRWRRLAVWLRRHPLLTGTLVAGAVLVKPKRSLGLLRWVLLGTRLWRAAAK
ncbi:MAG: hypothetical protein KGI47_07105 [Betaproteobacteria bacterium]|nr:hypothetical protein [Betaproteobacteria bacterium]MDE2622421.1 hypothetical protein [Betaproteobacteria bacterium]